MDEKNKRVFSGEDFDIPVTGRKPYAPPAERDTGAVEVRDGELSSAEANVTSGGFRIPPAGRDAAASRNIRTARYSSTGANYRQTPPPTHSESESEKPILEYSAHGPQITRVTVRPWPVSYSFYEKFSADAHKAHTMKGSLAPHVPFFSYIPQYSQLKATQWAYYLYMRECARQGKALVDADFSYIILYVYELINLGSVFPPAEGAASLAQVWSLYRPYHPMLDKYMSEWMADYCTVHCTPLPKSVYPFLAEAMARSTFKEFYLDVALRQREDLAGPALRLALSDYAPEKSRYAKDDPSFADEVTQVFDLVIPELKRRGESIFAPKSARELTIIRDAYSGSLCSSIAKRRIEVTMRTFIRSVESRRAVTELLKGCENIVRARHGIKARLSAPPVGALPVSATAASAEEARYLSFYDSPTEELTPERAAQIEAESWQNTEVLTDMAEDLDSDETAELPEGALYFGGAEDEPPRSIPDGEESADTAPTDKSNEGLLTVLGKSDSRLADALARASKGKAFTEVCRELGLFADDAAARINEAASDALGDVVLEPCDSGYAFIEDYADDIL